MSQRKVVTIFALYFVRGAFMSAKIGTFTVQVNFDHTLEKAYQKWNNVERGVKVTRSPMPGDGFRVVGSDNSYETWTIENRGFSKGWSTRSYKGSYRSVAGLATSESELHSSL